MKAAESGVQSPPLRIEGVDISPKQDEGVLKVRAGRRGHLWPAGGGRAPTGRSTGPGGPPLQPPGQSWSGCAAGGRLHRLPEPGCVVWEREGGLGAGTSSWPFFRPPGKPVVWAQAPDPAAPAPVCTMQPGGSGRSGEKTGGTGRGGAREGQLGDLGQRAPGPGPAPTPPLPHFIPAPPLRPSFPASSSREGPGAAFVGGSARACLPLALSAKT